MSDPIKSGAGRICAPPLLLAGLALAIFLVPGAGTLFQFEPGRPFTALTGHFAHWNFSHLLWDTVALAALGMLCCYFSPARFWITLAASAIAIPIAVGICQPELASYRGLSGIDSALLGLALIEFGRHSLRQNRRDLMLLSYGVGAGFCSKLVFEYLSGEALFVSPGEAVFVNVPLAHLVGFGCGVIVAFAYERLRLIRVGQSDSIQIESQNFPPAAAIQPKPAPCPIEPPLSSAPPAP